MAFAIVRLQKLKSGAQVASACRHNYRDQVPYYARPDIPQDKRQYTLHAGLPTADSALERYKSNLPEKVRKDAVHAFEVIVSAPPDWLKISVDDPDLQAKVEKVADTIEKYFAEATRWLAKRFGGEKNLVSVNVHRDEKTPHLHLVVMPLREGKLNAKSYLNGPADLRQFQTDFAQQVGKKYSLERGVPKARTGRHHLDHKEYHHIADQAVKTALEQKEREIQKAVQRRGRGI